MPSRSASRSLLRTATALALLSLSACTTPAASGAEEPSVEQAVVIPAPEIDESLSGSATATATLAGGCFWGVQAVFQQVDGVLMAVSGYAGGDAGTATYNLVSSGKTGHAETVQITYDPSRTSYGELLHIYFSVVHDPTQLNRQGPDRGPQYRSTIFPVTAEQLEIAESYIAQLETAGMYSKPIVTTLETGHQFYPAEEYHQDFMFRNPNHPYILTHDAPKVRDLQRLFGDIYRENPVLVYGAGQG